MADFSYVSGPSSQPLIGQTIGAYFDRVCADHEHRLALVSRHQGLRWTYAELRAKVDALATGLLSYGLVPGDRVGIWAPNCAEWILAQFATAKVGMVLVNINPAYRLTELEYVLNKVGCRALISAEVHKSSRYLDMIQDLAPELHGALAGQLHAARVPSLQLVVSIAETEYTGCVPFAQMLENGVDAQRLAEVAATLDFDDPINIQFTSGTTGFPKGATLSHFNILNNGFFVGEAIGLSTGDKVCIPVPLYHCFGMVMGNLACLTHAATMVYPEAGFDAGSTLAAVQEEGCVALYGVPTMFIAMLNHSNFTSTDLSSLRTGIMAGSPCPIEVMHRVVSEMHMPQVTIAYGMTETSPVSFQSGVDDSLQRRVSTVGRIHPHIEVKIVDEHGRVVPRGEPGELCTRGYSVMLGYWDDAERTSEVLDRKGWMHTGDLAVIDDEGFCNIVGRIKDMVIRGGENIYPREIEEFLYRHSAIRDVQVVGVPDRQYGEELCAWIVRQPGAALDENDVRTFCKGQIAHYKIPRYIRFVDEFPTTVTGKIQKFVIRKSMIAELALVEDATA